jgi:adenylate cyclase
VNMYYLIRIRPEFAADAAGITPNDRFWKQE